MKWHPDPDFRPDPARGVFLSGQIDPGSVSALFPHVLKISGPDPVTLYIDSPGGRPAYATLLQRMLVAPGQDTGTRRRLITVATGFVASAAADLLIAGDYTLAYEHAVIMMHGVRQSSNDDITTESAAQLARSLASSNEQFALTLAGNCVSTFFFRVAAVIERLHKMGMQEEHQHQSDVECFIELLREHVSPEVQELLSKACAQCKEMAALYQAVSKTIEPLFSAEADLPRFAEIEAAMFKAVLDRELESHPEKDFALGEQGFELLRQKMVLLSDQAADRHKQQVSTLFERWGADLLTPPEANSVTQSPKESWVEKAKEITEPRIREFWFLLVSMCRGLQTADFFLSAEEAYWLGFVDEVIGKPDLPSPRIFAEYRQSNQTLGEEDERVGQADGK